MSDLFIKLAMLVVFFGVMIAIGLSCRHHANNVAGFVLGGRSVGPWLTAFAYGTSYFSAVVFVGYAGQFGWKYGIARNVGGHRQRHFRLAARLGSAWPPHPRDEQHLNAATMPQFFQERFQSRGMKLAASASFLCSSSRIPHRFITA